MTQREKRENLAEKYFREGYNCSQSLVAAFSDILPLDFDTLMRLSSAFGGGMGRLRECCGAVSGMAIVIGLLYGYETPDNGDIKNTLYKSVQEPALEFEKTNKSLVCRELLGKACGHDSPISEKRSDNFYDTRPCVKLIRSGAGILSDYLEKRRIYDKEVNSATSEEYNEIQT